MAEEKKKSSVKAKKAGTAKKAVPKKKRPSTSSTNGYVPNLFRGYQNDIVPALKKKLHLKNNLEVPCLEKISLNIGIGNAKDEKASLEHAVDDLTTISGQKAVITRAKKAISNFKLRVGDPVGCRVTLRKWMMYEFLERLVSIALPRVRDFNGLSIKSFDGRGNFNFGIEEQIVFPEIDYDKIDRVRGLDITIVTTANNDEGGYELLKSLGFPFKEKDPFTSKVQDVEEVDEESSPESVEEVA